MLKYLIVLILSVFSFANGTALPKQCGENEQLKTSGIDCLTCQNYEIARCQTVYENKCYCLDGYVRNSQGKCVHTNECKKEKPQICGKNEQWKTSGIDCLTCQNYEIAKCETINTPQCYCLDNYVRNFENVCVPTSECEKELCKRENEHFTVETPCQYTCGGSNSMIPRQCNSTQIGGCVCNYGYVRCHETGECLPENDCYPVCDENEIPEIIQCKEPRCVNHVRTMYPCAMIYLTTCKTGCRCKEGFIRDDKTQRCISDRECSCGTTRTT